MPFSVNIVGGRAGHAKSKRLSRSRSTAARSSCVSQRARARRSAPYVDSPSPDRIARSTSGSRNTELAAGSAPRNRVSRSLVAGAVALMRPSRGECVARAGDAQPRTSYPGEPSPPDGAGGGAGIVGGGVEEGGR
jgi:hypothetical protein